jgi:ribosome maturation factor RimP
MQLMTLEEIHQKIETLANRIFGEAGMELIELKVNGHKNDVLIQITADKPNGGINIRECAILNKSLVAAIEQESLLPPEIFSLELSSPGLDRPLVTHRDFMRSKGRELHFWFTGPVGIDAKKEAQGILADVRENELIIDVHGTPLAVPLSTVIKGLLVI